MTDLPLCPIALGGESIRFHPRQDPSAQVYGHRPKTCTSSNIRRILSLRCLYL